LTECECQAYLRAPSLFRARVSEHANYYGISLVIHGYSTEILLAGGMPMKIIRVFLIVASTMCVLTGIFSPKVYSAPGREVAFTIDDLPAAAAEFMTGPEITDMTARLVATLKQQGIPVVGFVNEKKLYKWGEVDDRIKALEMWVDAGFELGNHTYSHMSLNRNTLHDWEDDVVQGEPVIRLLLAQHNMKLRYFRHPYLDTGRDLQTRREAEAFLATRGYRIAPVTLDAWDWMFATLYDDARKRGDIALQKEVTASYLSYSDAVFAYDEQLSKQIMGYEPKQVILLHGNQLEADHIGDLADVFRKRGYRFITLEDALGDQAYGMPNTYVGEEGMSWLEQWAITQGKPPHGEPEFPASIMQRAQAVRHPQ
jgi:peptidoglycan/xylan/chitin deacetylase (PgdA/CDA1 family)